MGYLTTLSIYNDGADILKKEPEKLADIIYNACLGVYDRRGHTNQVPLGNHCNLITVQKPRHADDHTVYVHHGNGVTEMNAYSSYTKDLLERCPEYFDTLLKELELQVKSLKELKAKNV
jgi:hypothetical protein